MRAVQQTRTQVVRPFNSLKSFDRLMGAGVSEQQAREFIGIFEDSINASVENLTTKPELEAAVTTLRSEIQAVRSDMQALEISLRSEVQAVRSDMQASEALIRADMQTLEVSLKAEIKNEVSAAKAELKQDIHEQSKRLSALESGQTLLLRLFFGGTLATLLGIGSLFLHQG